MIKDYLLGDEDATMGGDDTAPATEPEATPEESPAEESAETTEAPVGGEESAE